MKVINRILTNKDRETLNSIVDELFSLCPAMMARKIPEANVQQAFTFSTAKKYATLDSEILSAGSFEDTATEGLKKQGYKVTDVDPNINTDLHNFYLQNSSKYDIIVSTSVLEHVKNDEEFIEDCCKLLKDGGYAIFTMDFNDDYYPGKEVPATVIRQYTKYDLEERLPKVLEANDCELVGSHNWNAAPDFFYQGHIYSFATFVFRKKEKEG